MTTEKKWYAVYTRPRWEKKVASVFNKNSITNYCPINRVVRQWSDRKKVIYEPLFRPFVFVQISKPEFLDVRKTDGVVNFVTWLGKPAVIRDEEIDLIQRFLRDHQNLQLKSSKVNINDTVRIVKGPLIAQEGNVVLVKNNRIKITLPSLGYVLIAEVDTSDIEIVEKVK
jgi:transcription antitermination factor NusG